LAAPQGSVLATAVTGDPLEIVGRSDDGAWLLATDGEGVTGWVARGQVVTFGVEVVPVLALPAAGHVASGSAASPESASHQPAGQTGTVSGTRGSSLDGEVVANGVRLNVRSGPATTYAIVAKLADRAALSLLARNENSTWVQVALEADGFGWVSARFVTTGGAMDELPVSDAISDAPVLAAPAPRVSTQTTQSPIANLPSPQTVSSSPSGLTGKLALSAADGSIVLYDLAGGSARRLTSGFDPAISPDGGKVAFLRGGLGLFVIDADGSNERLLYSGGEEMRAPAWSPDGEFIVFSRVNGQDTCRSLGFGFCLPDNPQLSQYPLVRKDLRTLSRIGLDKENFQDLPTLDTATAPSWNDAGIVYQSNSGLQITQDGPDRDKDGNRVNRELTREYLHRDPDWRPDGARIVLMDATANHQEIYAINPDGSGLTPLTRPASALLETLPHNVAPVWSPDGQSIAFLSNRDGEWAVYVMDGDGSNQRRLAVGVEMNYRFQNEQVISWGK
ncbi:MAG: SH3 domain-containing protein, partial [Caldilineaceae bacterium]